ncbi:MAG: pyridoxamine 5'-phosphate oxidase [Ferruginibacter sp.]
MNSIADIRKDYKLQTLNEADVDLNPIAQFSKWWNEATQSEIVEVNAMTLATATPQGKPSARIVLLKGFDENGFVFFTNYNSHKANEIAENGHAALVFFWKELERQVRIEGLVTKVSDAASDEYFNSRPEGSKIGAWASPQSKVILARTVIENNVTEIEKNFSGKEIERPPHWGGYVVKPNLIEFWQGRSSRLHDRIQYSIEENSWLIERLAP